MIELLLKVGIFLIVISLIGTIFLAFRQGFLWGVASLLISPIPFLIVHFESSKKVLMLFFIGVLMLVPVFMAIPEVTDEQSYAVTKAIKRIIREKNGDFGFSNNIKREIGGYVRCGYEGGISASYNFLNNDFPKEWTVVVDCGYTKKRVSLEINVIEYENGNWSYESANLLTPDML
ncbi:MAG: hypothetical protein COA99_02395 [Moraxellaceae bacterium]|nr:MAG: hypothetical protein COA99_02395 [Moraxellaceae bacterium]